MAKYKALANTNLHIAMLTTGDSLNVGTEAFTWGDVFESFVATAKSSNNGNITLQCIGIPSIAPQVIDVSAAGGISGFTLSGRDSHLDLTQDILIGSSRGDFINGGNGYQRPGAQDTLTGGQGNDVFYFTTNVSVPMQSSQATMLPGVDRELVYVNAGASKGGNIILDFEINSVVKSLTVPVPAGSSANTVASLIAASWNNVIGFSAVQFGNQVSVQSAFGSSLKILSVSPGATLSSLSFANGSDQLQQTKITLGNAASDPLTAGHYIIEIDPVAAGKPTVSLDYDARGGETVADVLWHHSDLINEMPLQFGCSASVSDNVLTLTDTNGDDGGFVVQFIAGGGGFTGSGASVIGATGSSLSEVAADLITDFVSGADKIDLGLVAGSATNYAEAAQAASYGHALNAANTALDGVVRYYLTSLADNDATPTFNDATGLLFFDADADGWVDGVIALTGISSASFADSDIIGYGDDVDYAAVDIIVSPGDVLA